MKIRLYLLIIFSIALIAFSSQYAYCSESDEVSVSETYKKLCWLLKENTSEVFFQEYGSDAFNYGVEILKKAPQSFEAYCSMFLINANAFGCYRYTIEEKYDVLKEKHLPNIDDPNFEDGEKLIFLMMYGGGIGTISLEERKERQIKGCNVLKNMKENCTNKDYAALASAFLFLAPSKNERIENIKYFLEKFPNHPAIPDAELLLVNNSFLDDDATKCIEEAMKLKVKYGNLQLPHDWTFSISCYNLIVNCYYALKDYDNAKKYYDLIEKEAPRHWNLKKLKEMLDEMQPPQNK